MVCFRGIGHGFRLLLCAFISIVVTSPAFAKSRLKQASISIDTFVGEKASITHTNTPARFFTIKDVLAGLDAKRASGNASAADRTRVASLGTLAIPDQSRNAQLDSTQRGLEPFGLFSFQAPNGALWVKWRAVESELAIEARAITECSRDESNCSSAARRFLRIVEAVKARDGRARIEEANRNINLAIRYVSDFAQHGEPDRWSTPLATLSVSRGDCEDYAIAKYMVLKEAGLSAEDLRLVLVRDRRAREDHAVLAVRHDGQWLILDNRYGSVVADIEIGYFVPLYAINNDGVKLFAAPYVKPPVVEPVIAAERTAAEPAPTGWYELAPVTEDRPLADVAVENHPFAWAGASADSQPLVF